MDLVRREEHVVDAIDLIQRRLRGSTILVLPTVIQELTFIAHHGDTARELAEARNELGVS